MAIALDTKGPEIRTGFLEGDDGRLELTLEKGQYCTVFRKAYILSGSGFHKFLYSIIESLRKIREIAEFIPNQLRFHEKKL